MTRLEQIKQRVERATKGPWEVDGASVLVPVDGPGGWPLIVTFQFETEDGPATTAYERENADFVGHARTDLPLLIVAVEAALRLDKFFVSRDVLPASAVEKSAQELRAVLAPLLAEAEEAR